MNIEIKRKVKFKTLLIAVNMILVLVFQSIYIGVNMQKLKSSAYSAEEESIRAYHAYLCKNFSACMYEVDALRFFIERNQLGKYVTKYLNLIEPSEAELETGAVRSTLQNLSVSQEIIDDFVVFGKNANQKNLYFNVLNCELEEKPLPTVDLLEKARLDGLIHTNLGYMVHCTDKQLRQVRTDHLSEQEKEAVDHMIQYLRDEYVVCSYISNNLSIIRLNKKYVEDKFRMKEDNKFVVYDASKRPVLYFNMNGEDANALLQQSDREPHGSVDGESDFSISSNIYGKLSAITERESRDIYYSSARSGYVYLLLFACGILISLFFTLLFSGKMFKKIELLYKAIRKQTKTPSFDSMRLDGGKGRLKRFGFSARIFLTLACSCLTSLILVSAVFQVLVEKETRNIAKELGEELARNYANECVVHYDRYNSLSTVKMEEFLEHYRYNDDQTNNELIRSFEKDFYYETTFLPGYLYAFIVDNNYEALYQTVFFSQTEESSELVRSAIKKAEQFKTFKEDGVFVPVKDLMSGKEVLAFVKTVSCEGEKKGTVIIVSDIPKISMEEINRAILTDFLIVGPDDKVLIGNAANYHSENLAANEEIFYSVDETTVDHLGKCVVLVYYSFYLNQIKEIQYLNLIWILIIGVVCIIASSLLRRLLINLFGILEKSMNDTPEKGYQPIPESFAVDEIDAIAVTYNKMMIRMEKLVEDSIRQEAERNELEILQAQTEFKMLEQQINPHFLFNTLECINLLAIKSGETHISKIVKSLSAILRYAVSRETKVTVKREMSVLQSYIEIQRYRFDGRFCIELDVDESLYNVHMIKFVLQPILENAISHGMSQTTSGGKISITLSCYDSGLEFRVCDNGVGMSQEKLEELRETLYGRKEKDELKKEGGIGLRNVCRRIELFYKGEGDFIVNSTEEKGTEVIVRLPFEL